MGIPLFDLMSNTPDRVRSVESSDAKGRVFTWCLRDKKDPGINVKMLSVPTTDGGTEWEIRIHRVEWEGNEFNESEKPMVSYTHETSKEAISCAEREIKDLCSNRSEFSHCLDFLRN